MYRQNLELLRSLNALAAQKLELREFDRLHFCETETHELNLCEKQGEITHYYHAPLGALKEAQCALTEDILAQHQVIYFYGLGLAYIYEALRAWLEKESTHHLVLLENDLEVIDCFLHTARATEMLRNRQVTLFYFEDERDEFKFYKLHSQFINLKIYFLALPYYAMRYTEASFNLCYRILYDHAKMTLLCNEYLTGQSAFLRNFYRNLLYLPDSYLGSHLFGKFEGIPAIICGAGPSLEKNIHVLKNLKDRALIFAGGSALNVLNGYELIPHFGLGIDPNPEQYHRLLTNHTFHLPFFFRPRMEHAAFQMIQGPRLYIPGSMHQLPAWFEEQLHLSSSEIDEGHNVVNFCTEIASSMGCNPIIYVGMDLAFTEIKTYAKGIETHPIWLGYQNPYGYEKEQMAILRQGINGELIKTKWDWILESDWLSHYVKEHPSQKFINATEGGLGFQAVPNCSLSEVAEQYLTRSYDLQGLVHAEIQESRLKLKRGDILRLMMDFKASLTRCRINCQKICEIEQARTGSDSFSTQQILYEALLQDEIAYHTFLSIYESLYTYLDKQFASSPHVSSLFLRYQFLDHILTQHISLLNQAIQLCLSSPPPLIGKPAPSPPVTKDIYHWDAKQLKIQDAELALHVTETHAAGLIQEVTKSYSNGAIKRQSFYKGNRLHGPSRFYTDQGILVAESWFIEGLREGKMKLFYPSGSLYAIERYKNNAYEGRQEYFFENGQPHLIYHYQEGKLEGEVLIYTSEGKKLRELHYQQGQRHGIEKMWDQNGHLLLECEYAEGVPVGTARQWTATGALQREVKIYQFPQDFDLEVWGEEGQLLQRFVHGREDFSEYYEKTEKQMEFLDKAIHLIMEHVETLIKPHLDLENPVSQQASEELMKIRKEMEQLEKMKIEWLNLKKEHE